MTDTPDAAPDRLRRLLGGVAILLEIYAKCLDGQDAIAKRRIEDALGDPGEDEPTPPDDGNGQT